MSTILLATFLLLSVAALTLSAAWHVATLTSLDFSLFDLLDSMSSNVAFVFLAWGPSVYVGYRLTRGQKDRSFRVAILAHCPGWMRYLLYLLYAYVGVLFAVVMPLLNTYSDGVRGTFALHSALYVVVSFIAFVILYSSIRRRLVNRERNGLRNQELPSEVLVLQRTTRRKLS